MEWQAFNIKREGKKMSDNNDFSDLLYMEKPEQYETVQVDILSEFPEAEFEDASDFIHQYRLELTIPNLTDQSQFYKFAIQKGFAMCCFGFQMRVMNKPEKIKTWLVELGLLEKENVYDAKEVEK